MPLQGDLQQRLDSLPARPGCYLFRGRAPAGKGKGPSAGEASELGEVLYVGKAKSLRARVRSYFQEGSSDGRFFVPLLRRVVFDLDTVVTATEKEAAILENALIKQYQPRYNVKLRDNKEFLTLRLDAAHEWPRLDVVRRPADDGARYFGPYHSATSARRSLHLVNKHFQLRTCSDAELLGRSRPCLQHQIKRCPAPCVYPVDRVWYREQVRAVELFLSGRHDELSRTLKERMANAARATEFELAAIYRDQLRAVDAMRMEQRVVQTGAALHVSQDVVGLFREADLVEIVVLYVRGGRVSDTADYALKGAELSDEEIVAAFLAQHYAATSEGGTEPPDEILVPCAPEALAGIEEVLAERRGARVGVVVPQRGPRAQLVRMAIDNARHVFEQKRRARDDLEERLEELRVRLRLPALPHRIECCDISHLGGGDTVGAVVALIDGAPAPRRYKSFHVRGVGEGDDYAAMYEVLSRRFRRGRAAAGGAEAPRVREPGKGEEQGPDWDLPDLFVVDGGKGQLAVALAAASDLGLHQLPIVALAKEKREALGPMAASERGRGETGAEVVDRVYLPGQKNPIPVREHSASMFFLARARDEAHRFSNRVRERLGKKRRLRSRLDDVPGLGPVTRKALLRVLGSMQAVEGASDEALLAVPGFTRRHLAALRRAIPAPR